MGIGWQEYLFVVLLVLGAIICLFAYFLPMLLAIFKKHEKRLTISLVNIFLGWSIIGWIIAFILATKKRNEK